MTAREGPDFDEPHIDVTVEALAIEAARRHGLEGAELQRPGCGRQDLPRDESDRAMIEPAAT